MHDLMVTGDTMPDGIDIGWGVGGHTGSYVLPDAVSEGVFANARRVRMVRGCQR